LSISLHGKSLLSYTPNTLYIKQSSLHWNDNKSKGDKSRTKNCFRHGKTLFWFMERSYYRQFFTSLPLAQELFNQHLTITGTLRTNKREIPNEFLPNTSRSENSSMFGFSDQLTLVSYVPKKSCSLALHSVSW
jgi:hypothetical protein